MNKKKIFIPIVIAVLIAGLFMYTRMPISSGSSSLLALHRVLDQFVPGGLSNPMLDTLNFLVRKGTHMVVYGVLAYFTWRMLRNRRNAYFIAWLITTGIAMLDEWHQSYIPWRTAQISDVLLDSASAALVLSCLYLYRRSRQQKTSI